MGINDLVATNMSSFKIPESLQPLLDPFQIKYFEELIELLEVTLEVPDEGVHPYELIKLARKKNLIKKTSNKPVDLKDGEFTVPMKEKSKEARINPITGRQKKFKTKKWFITNIKPEDRTLNNLPRYAKQGTGRFSRGAPKVRFQDWLMFKDGSRSHHSVGHGCDGKWYGWSHRAIHGFGIGDVIKPGHIGNKFEYGKEVDKKYEDMAKKHGYDIADKWRKDTCGKFEPYKIKTDDEAFAHAERFAADVS
jgi:hypothetical protein